MLVCFGVINLCVWYLGIVKWCLIIKDWDGCVYLGDFDGLIIKCLLIEFFVWFICLCICVDLYEVIIFL